MKLAQLFEDAAEHVFQLRLACKQLQKLGYNPTYVNDWTRVVTKDFISVASQPGSDMSVSIRYNEDDFQDKPWQVMWYNRGVLQLSDKFADFEEVVDDIAPIGPLKEGVGADALAFSDYINTKVVKEVKAVRMFEKVAVMLFKDGYKWNGDPAPEHFDEDPNPRFEKGDLQIEPYGRKGH